MRFTAIETASWEELKRQIGELTQTMRTLFGKQVPNPDLLHNGDVCQRLFLSPRTLQDYRDKGILPYTQIAGKILYRLSDINRVLKENYKHSRK
ncbi:helix-turn-helix domain-containing protein [Porphyromonas macacae]|uniref:helix-turn-helix domain-containing protein n=1 Tax=Porphyromonas macacae TaxID=28115 RepID=UPI0035A1856E